MKKQLLKQCLLIFLGLTIIPGCNKKQTESKQTTIADSVSAFALDGAWKMKGSSIAKFTNPTAKELVPGIFELGPFAPVLKFDSSGKYSRESQVQPMNSSGKWKLEAEILTLTDSDNDDLKFTLKVIDKTHIVLKRAIDEISEYYAKEPSSTH